MERTAYLELLDKSAWGKRGKSFLQSLLEDSSNRHVRVIYVALAGSAYAGEASHGCAMLALLDRYAAECGPVGCRR